MESILLQVRDAGQATGMHIRTLESAPPRMRFEHMRGSCRSRPCKNRTQESVLQATRCSGTKQGQQEGCESGTNGDTQIRKRPDFWSGLVRNFLILVERKGIEPSTFALRTRRSPS